MDDCLTFCRAKELECLVFKSLLKTFEVVSRENPKFPKSAILFSPNINKDRGNYFSNLLGVKMLNDLGNYLGLPFNISRINSKEFKFI